MSGIGLALGGGGAKGLAHVPILEEFDRAGVAPSSIAGTSIGAIIGAMYAAGRSGRFIRDFASTHIPTSEESLGNNLRKIFGSSIADAFSFNFGRGSLLKHDKLDDFFAEAFGVTTFEELKIPLKVVAGDFWARTEVVFESGDLISAVRASMAIPGIFQPIEINGRILVDGGVVNPLPFDLLRGQCDRIVAVNVQGSKTPGENPMPRTMDTIFGAFEILEAALVAERLKSGEPDLRLRPEIHDVRALEFHKASQIYRGAEPEVLKLRDWLANGSG